MAKVNRNQKMGIVLKDKAKAKPKANKKANRFLSSLRKEWAKEKAKQRVKRVNQSLLKENLTGKAKLQTSPIPVCHPRHPRAIPRSNAIFAI